MASSSRRAFSNRLIRRVYRHGNLTTLFRSARPGSAGDLTARQSKRPNAAAPWVLGQSLEPFGQLATEASTLVHAPVVSSIQGPTESLAQAQPSADAAQSLMQRQPLSPTNMAVGAHLNIPTKGDVMARLAAAASLPATTIPASPVPNESASLPPVPGGTATPALQADSSLDTKTAAPPQNDQTVVQTAEDRTWARLMAIKHAHERKAAGVSPGGQSVAHTDTRRQPDQPQPSIRRESAAGILQKQLQDTPETVQPRLEEMPGTPSVAPARITDAPSPLTKQAHSAAGQTQASQPARAESSTGLVNQPEQQRDVNTNVSAGEQLQRIQSKPATASGARPQAIAEPSSGHGPIHPTVAARASAESDHPAIANTPIEQLSHPTGEPVLPSLASQRGAQEKIAPEESMATPDQLTDSTNWPHEANHPATAVADEALDAALSGEQDLIAGVLTHVQTQPVDVPVPTEASASASMTNAVEPDLIAIDDRPPLEAVWPVQSASAQTTAAAEDPSLSNEETKEQPVPLSASLSRTTAPDLHRSHIVPATNRAEQETQARVEHLLAAAQPVMPTESSVHVMTPRRPRPVYKRSAQAVQRALQPGPQPTSFDEQSSSIESNPVDKQQPNIQLPRASAAGMVDTEIGELPQDLWQLVGEPAPQAASTVLSTTRQNDPVNTQIAQTAQNEPLISPPRNVYLSAAQPATLEADGGPLLQRPHERVLTNEVAVHGARLATDAQVPAIQRQALDAVMRAAEDVQPNSDLAMDSAGSTSARQAEPAPPMPDLSAADIEDLTRQVYSRVRRQLAVERERQR